MLPSVATTAAFGLIPGSLLGLSASTGFGLLLPVIFFFPALIFLPFTLLTRPLLGPLALLLMKQAVRLGGICIVHVLIVMGVVVPIATRYHNVFELRFD
jgi:hypothetical protein